MSTISAGRKSNLTSRTSLSKSSRRSVRFQLNYNLKSVLTDFENEKEQQNYKELICSIRDAGLEVKDDDLLQILTEARACINILDKAHHLFVQVLLVAKWAHRSAEIAEAYQGFVIDLCSAHNYFTKPAIEQLVLNFKSASALAEIGNGDQIEDDEVYFQRTHSVLKSLLQVVPMSVDLLVSTVKSSFPYTKSKEPIEHVTYIRNVLCILDYRPDLRPQFLSLIFNKLLALDVNAPRSELDDGGSENSGVFQLDESEAGIKHNIADSLDLSLEVMYAFIYSQCHPNSMFCFQRTKALYIELIAVFDSVILPTHASHHIQFLYFFFFSFKSNLVMWFLQYLWKKVTDPNVFHVIRQAAIGYIVSFLSRAKYVPMSAVKDMLTKLSGWIHSYINTSDGRPSCDPRVHTVFYSACQALFYLIAFRHKDIVLHSSKGLAFLQGLNLSQVVTCQLNPLRVCLPAVTHNFAAVSRHYQLAYCNSIIEHNQRSVLPVVYRDSTGAEISSSQVYLDTFFPFDPYLLKRTLRYISEMYREYDGSLPEENVRKGTASSEGREEEDDFLMDTASPANCSMFSYGTSPGFLQA